MIAVRDLTVEHTVDPVGVGADPRFGWTLHADTDTDTDTAGVRQTAYRLTVADADGVVYADAVRHLFGLGEEEQQS